MIQINFLFIYILLMIFGSTPLWAAKKIDSSKNDSKISKAVSNLDPEILDIKSKLEDVITKRYKDRIATQIDPSAFTVSVQIFLNEKPEKPIPKIVEKKEKTELDAKEKTEKDKTEKPVDVNNFTLKDMPQELIVGTVQLGTLIEQYRMELLNLKEKDRDRDRQREINRDKEIEKLIQHTQEQLNTKQQPAAEPSIFSKYEIAKVQIWVGLDKGFSAKYKADFETWLSESIHIEFGKNEEHKVFTIQKIVVPEKQIVVSTMDRVSNLQILIGFVLISFILLISTIVIKLIPSRDVKEQIKMAVQIEEMKSIQQQNNYNANSNTALTSGSGSKGLSSKEDSDEDINIEFVYSTYKELQAKVAFLITSEVGILDQVVDIWLELGWNGRMKITASLDSVLSKLGSKDTTIHFNIPEKLTKDRNIHEAFKKFTDLNLDERYQILEQAYWEILSTKMLGDKIIKEKFTSLSDLSSEKLQRVLLPQSGKVKALALLHLPQEKIQAYVTDLTIDDKKRIIEESIKLEKVSEKEIDLVDETLKFQAKKENNESESMHIRDLVPNLLSTLTVREEFEILKEITTKTTDNGLFIKKSYPSLVFIDEWPQDQVQLLLNRMDLKIIQSLVQVAPYSANVVFNAIPKKSMQIVRDDLAAGKKIMDSDVDKNLLQLKYKLLKLINDDTIHLDKIFKTTIRQQEAA